MNMGERIATLRKSRGWTQRNLATQLNISRQAVSKWESNDALPDIENILLLCDLFGVTSDYLLGRSLENVTLKKVSQTNQSKYRLLFWPLKILLATYLIFIFSQAFSVMWYDSFGEFLQVLNLMEIFIFIMFIGFIGFIMWAIDIIKQLNK